MDNMRILSILLVTLFTFNVFAQDTEEGMYDPAAKKILDKVSQKYNCLLYTSPSPRDRQKSRMPSSA